MKEKLKELFAPCQPELAELKAEQAISVFKTYIVKVQSEELEKQLATEDIKLNNKYHHNVMFCSELYKKLDELKKSIIT